MTAADPVAYGLLDGTGVCGAGRGTPSAREMTIGQGFPSLNQPDKGADRDLPCWFRAGFALGHLFCYNIVGNPSELFGGIPAEGRNK